MIKIPVSPPEKHLTYKIANDWSSEGLDPLMVMISDPYRWMTPTLVLVMVLIFIDWQTALQAIFLGGTGAAIADGINTRLLKKHSDRIRPGKQFNDIRSLGIMNRGKKSFPSNHASNTMAFAVGLSIVYPPFGFISIFLALMVGYSRIYCGAHFPFDVLFGFLHGTFWVALIHLAYKALL